MLTVGLGALCGVLHCIGAMCAVGSVAWSRLGVIMRPMIRDVVGDQFLM